MITDAVFGLFRSMVQALIDLMPDWGPPDLTGMLDSISPLWEYLAWGNKYAPLVEMGALMAVMVAFKIGLYLTNLVVWALTKAHVLGGA